MYIATGHKVYSISCWVLFLCGYVTFMLPNPWGRGCCGIALHLHVNIRFMWSFFFSCAFVLTDVRVPNGDEASVITMTFEFMLFEHIGLVPKGMISCFIMYIVKYIFSYIDPETSWYCIFVFVCTPIYVPVFDGNKIPTYLPNITN